MSETTLHILHTYGNSGEKPWNKGKQNIMRGDSQTYVSCVIRIYRMISTTCYLEQFLKCSNKAKTIAFKLLQFFLHFLYSLFSIVHFSTFSALILAQCRFAKTKEKKYCLKNKISSRKVKMYFPINRFTISSCLLLS